MSKTREIESRSCTPVDSDGSFAISMVTEEGEYILIRFPKDGRQVALIAEKAAAYLGGMVRSLL